MYAGSSANADSAAARASFVRPAIANATALLRRTDGDFGSRASAFENASSAVSIALSPRVMMAVQARAFVLAAGRFVHHAFRHTVQLGHRLTGLVEAIQHTRGADANRRLVRIDRDRPAVVIERFGVAAGRLVRLSGAQMNDPGKRMSVSVERIRDPALALRDAAAIDFVQPHAHLLFRAAVVQARGPRRDGRLPRRATSAGDRSGAQARARTRSIAQETAPPAATTSAT